MKISFSDVFIDPMTNRNLSLDFLKKNNFAARPVIDGFNVNDLRYFDEVTGIQNDRMYKLYHAEWKHEEKIDIASSIEELYEIFNKINYENIIIEFCNKDLFIWSEEIDYYVLFGNKHLINLINNYDYSYEYSMNMIREDGENEDYYIKFYNKYNIS